MPPWFTKNGLDLSKYPIDELLRKSLSANDVDFRTACTLLKSMCDEGRSEAGVFLIGLLLHYPENYPRLSLIADSLASYPSPETVAAFAGELRRVRGSSLTRGYLRAIIDGLERFPSKITEKQMVSLASDMSVGARFRQRLKSIIQDYGYGRRVEA